MWSRWTEKARAGIWAACEMAKAQELSQVAPEQLLLVLLRDDKSVASRLLNALEIDSNVLRARVLHALPDVSSDAAGDPGGTLVAPVVDAAYAEAWDLNTNYIGTEHLLLGLLRHRTPTSELLESEGVTLERLRQAWHKLTQHETAPGIRKQP